MSSVCHHPLWANLFRPIPGWKVRALDLLMQTPMFAGIPVRTVRLLVDDMYYRSYARGECVFEAGEAGLGMYLVLSGQVDIHLQSQQLAQLTEGDFFGEVALFGETPRTAAARAASAIELVGFFRPALDEWIQRSPKSGAQFLLQLGTVLAQRLGQVNRQLLLATGGDDR